MLEMELMNEEYENAGDNERGEELSSSDQVEREWWVGRRFLGHFISAMAENWAHLERKWDDQQVYVVNNRLYGYGLMSGRAR